MVQGVQLGAYSAMEVETTTWTERVLEAAVVTADATSAVVDGLTDALARLATTVVLAEFEAGVWGHR